MSVWLQSCFYRVNLVLISFLCENRRKWLGSGCKMQGFRTTTGAYASSKAISCKKTAPRFSLIYNSHASFSSLLCHGVHSGRLIFTGDVEYSPVEYDAQATVIFCSSLCFSEDLMRALGLEIQKLPKLRAILSL
eukprot:3862336-Rhodomonas_salina.2